MPAVIVLQHVHRYFLDGLHSTPVDNRWTNYYHTIALQANYSATEEINITLRQEVHWLYDKNSHEFRFIKQTLTRLNSATPRRDSPDDIILPHYPIIRTAPPTLTRRLDRPTEAPLPPPDHSPPRSGRRSRTPRRGRSHRRRPSPPGQPAPPPKAPPQPQRRTRDPAPPRQPANKSNRTGNIKPPSTDSYSPSSPTSPATKGDDGRPLR